MERVAVRRALIGLAGPVGYDYANPAPRVDKRDDSWPNPVLENVLGLLICYDEIVFLSRQFCPADLRRLPYVRFVSDDQQLSTAALKALDEYDALAHEEWPQQVDFSEWQTAIHTMTEGREDFRIDYHTHAVHMAGRAVHGKVNSDEAMRDLWIASELDLKNIDVVIGSPALRSLEAALEKELAEAYEAEHVKRTAAQRLAALRVPNFPGPKGSYHESLEDLRNRPHAVEFRQYLAEVTIETADGAKLAESISRQAFDFIDERERHNLRRGHWFESLAIPGVRGILNTLVPPAGTAVAAALKSPISLRDRAFKRQSQWAPFVVNLYRP